MGAAWGRGMMAAALGVGLGTAWQLQQAALWPAQGYAWLVLFSILLLLGIWLGLFWRSVRQRPTRRASAQVLAMRAWETLTWETLTWLTLASMLLGFALLAFGQAGWRALARAEQTLAPALEGRDLRVRGRVEGLPQVGADGLRFSLHLEGEQVPGLPVLPERLWLSWGQGGPADGGLQAAPAPLRAGDLWELPVRLRRPHGALNPGGFDAELWFFEQGVGATGVVRATRPGEAQRLAGPRWWQPLEQLAALRQRWRDQILLAPAEPAAVGLLAALAVGDQSAINSTGWDLYRRTGIAHLVSISGMHITLFAWLAGGLVERLWRWQPSWMSWCPAQQAGRWGGLLLALLYALLAGWGLPAQRTVGMLALAVVLRSLGPPWPGSLLCCLAGALVLLADPWAALAPGFWLSFVAVWLLITGTRQELLSPELEPAAAVPGALAGASAAAQPGPRWQAARRWARAIWREAWQAQWLVTVGLAPLTLLLFGQVSLVGWLANAVAVPVVTWLVTPLALLGVLWAPLWLAAAAVIVPLLAWLQWLAQSPMPVWVVPAAGPVAAALALLGGVWLVLPLPWRLRLAALPLWLPLLWPSLPRPAPGSFELIAADVGQGSAILVRTAEHLLVHDAGPQWSAEANAGQRVILPLLQALGEAQIDELVLSHKDADHVGGAAALLAGLPVGRLRSSLPPDHGLRKQARQDLGCAAGQRWQWDQVQFEVLHPAAGAALDVGRPNTVSCVLHVVDAQGRSALLTGDIESEQERALVHQYGQALRSTVLLVPHHGSHTSSSPEFLAAVAPDVAVIQAGYRSRYGHPHPEVIARFRDNGIQIVKTDQCGAWRWTAEQAACTRDVQRRYWHWRLASALPVGGAVVARVEPSGERE